MAAPGRPGYVEHAGEVSFPGPVRCTGAVLYTFWLQGDHGRLQALCERFFGAPSGGAATYLPLSSLVILTIGHIPEIRSGTWDTGTISESQVTIWVPVAAVRRQGVLAFAERVALFPYHMVVDNVFSLVSGREPYGLLKSFGWVETPTAIVAPPPERLTVDVLNLRRYGGDNTPRRWPLLSLARDAAAPGDTGRLLESPSELLAELRALLKAHPGGPWLLPGLELPLSLLEDAVTRSLPLVTLKQFRTPGGLGADYQAVVEAPVSLERLRAAQLLHPYDLTLAEYLASFPLAEDLGLADQRALLSFQIELDFTIGDGRTIWRAGERRRGCLGQLLGG